MKELNARMIEFVVIRQHVHIPHLELNDIIRGLMIKFDEEYVDSLGTKYSDSLNSSRPPP